MEPVQGADDYNQLTPRLTPGALQYFEARAEAEDSAALDVVFFAHLTGMGTVADWDVARTWLEKAWHVGTPLGALYHGRNLLGFELDSTYREDAYGKQLIEVADYRFSELAKDGNAVALYFQGVCREQLGDASGAYAYYSRSAQKGCVLAQGQLGLCSVNGVGTRKDGAAALRWLVPAAEAGLITAQDALGKLYFDGELLPRDDALAFKWSRRAALRGWPHAQHRLAQLYQLGRGVAQNEFFATEWYERAALQGLLPAQLQVARRYADGTGTLRDDEAAAEWFTRAALQHDASAEKQVGELFAVGRGVVLDNAEARHWLVLAAQHELSEHAQHLAAAPAPAPAPAAAPHALAEPVATDTHAEVIEADAERTARDPEATQRWYVAVEYSNDE